jgi:predicted RNA-binding protein YlqC (UPF0109 family)
MDDKTRDYKFLEAVISFLVEHPEAVKIGRVVDEMGVLLTLDVHPDDMRQVIGREGNTAKAIRTLLRVVGMKTNARVNLKINEPAGSDGQRVERPRPDRNFNQDRGGYRNNYRDRNYDRPTNDHDHGYAN